MTGSLKKLWSEESGQGLSEYGLILALVAIACVGALTFLRGGIDNILNEVGEQLGNTAE